MQFLCGNLKSVYVCIERREIAHLYFIIIYLVNSTCINKSKSAFVPKCILNNCIQVCTKYVQ